MQFPDSKKCCANCKHLEDYRYGYAREKGHTCRMLRDNLYFEIDDPYCVVTAIEPSDDFYCSFYERSFDAIS